MNVEPTSDNAEGVITTDDVLMLAVLFAILAGTIGLLIYVMLGGADDVAALLRK